MKIEVMFLVLDEYDYSEDKCKTRLFREQESAERYINENKAEYEAKKYKIIRLEVTE